MYTSENLEYNVLIVYQNYDIINYITSQDT